MLINHFRMQMLTCMIFINILSLVAYGEIIKLKFTFEDSINKQPKKNKIHKDILNMLKTTDNMINDLGGYESVKAVPIPMSKVGAAEFKNIIDILSTARKVLHVQKMQKDKKILKPLDINKIYAI